MSRIDELVERLCSQGVVHKQLHEIGTVYRGKRFVKDDMIAEGVPCIHYGEIYTKYGVSATKSFSFVSSELSRNLRFANPGDVIMATAGETVEDIGKAVAWLGSEPVAVHDACYVFSGSLEPKFVSYFFASRGFRDQIRQKISSSKISSISVENVSHARIPVPPLEVQQEIVRILDQFTQLEAELEAELEARRAQYEVLRNLLFARAVPPTEWNLLEETGTFERGSSLQKKDFVDSGVPCLHYGEIYTHFGVSARKSKSYVTEAFAKGKRFVEPGDVFIATTSENVNDLGKAVAWLADDRAVASNDAIIYRGTVEPRYVSHFLRSEHFQMQKLKFITGTKVMRLSAKALGSTLIPIPDQSIQASIADTLDKFEALINDLSVGLPAELNARRKQYEYYRDKLLTFKELAA